MATYQKGKISNSYSLWSLIKYGVPQSSIFGRIPLMYFYIFSLKLIDIRRCADDYTPYTIEKKKKDKV